MSLAFSIVVQGAKTVARKLDAYEKRAKAKDKKVIADALVSVHRDIVTSVSQGARTGRVYGKHQASAPGEPPKTDSGDLVRSFRITFNGDRMGGKVTTDSPYAVALELGTTLMEARPFFFPAVEKNRTKIITALIAANKY